MKFYIRLLFSSLLVFLFSCANKVIPSGGIKDIISPKVVYSAPENYSTNFNRKQIEIEFDEFIQLVDLNKQLIISPLIDPVPEITTSKRTLKIKFDEPLKENTTYTFNFGSAIADVHEKNVYENFLLVFSTGDYLDSLSVSGKVINAGNLKTEKGILVMLYKDHEDSVPYLKLPDYFAKTDSFGNYRINNISSGSFKAFALKDKNSNYLFDPPDEAIGFSDSLIVMSDSAKADIRMFMSLPGKIRLKNYSIEEAGKLKIIFNSRAEDVKLKTISLLKNPWETEEYTVNRDTVTLWMNDTTLDSLNIELLQNELPFDTALFVLKKKSSGRGTGTKGKTFFISSDAFGGVLNAGKDLTLSFTHPVAGMDESKIIFKKDSVPASGINYIFADSIKRNMTVKYNWKENESYELTFLPGAVKDIFNSENDTTKIPFRLKAATEFGSVALKLKTNDNKYDYIVQLVNERDEVIGEKTVTSSGSINFEFLDPGVYLFRIIFQADFTGETHKHS